MRADWDEWADSAEHMLVCTESSEESNLDQAAR